MTNQKRTLFFPHPHIWGWGREDSSWCPLRCTLHTSSKGLHQIFAALDALLCHTARDKREMKSQKRRYTVLFVYLSTDAANALWDFTRFNVLFIFSSTPTVVEIVGGGRHSLVPCFSNSVAKTEACFTFQHMFAAETAQRRNGTESPSARWAPWLGRFCQEAECQQLRVQRWLIHKNSDSNRFLHTRQKTAFYTMSFKSLGSMTHLCIELKQVYEVTILNALPSLWAHGNQPWSAEEASEHISV